MLYLKILFLKIFFFYLSIYLIFSLAIYLTEELLRIGINYMSHCCRTVAFGELPADWRVGSCSIGVRLRLKPKSNITLQAEPAFDRLTAVQPPPNTIRLFLFTTSNQLGEKLSVGQHFGLDADRL